MPTYEYQCQACGHSFEKFQSITASAIKKCPECKKNKVKRLIGTGAGIIFKGSGFYHTDYRNDSYKADAKKDTAPPPDCGSSDACKSCKHSEAAKEKPAGGD
ncbi:MAG: zinc ribbon domain-containing protein [Phycisphaerae bacterium]|nr:zinc ribbon domain-containing protein [Phycisphaerae bacterium]